MCWVQETPSRSQVKSIHPPTLPTVPSFWTQASFRLELNNTRHRCCSHRLALQLALHWFLLHTSSGQASRLLAATYTPHRRHPSSQQRQRLGAGQDNQSTKITLAEQLIILGPPWHLSDQSHTGPAPPGADTNGRSHYQAHATETTPIGSMAVSAAHGRPGSY